MTFALDYEFAPWRRLRRFQRISLRQQVVHTATVESAELCVAVTGVGGENAERVARSLFDGATGLCITSGLAGALSPKHAVGDLLAAERVLLAGGSAPVLSDSRLLGLAVACGAKRIGAFLTAEAPVVTIAEKRRLAAVADAVEMESRGILLAAQERGIPAVAIRAVSDAAGDELPMDFTGVLGESGHVSIPRLLVQLIAGPQRIPGLIRLGRSSRRAAMRLAEFLDAYVAALATRWNAGAPLTEVAAG